MKIISVSHKRKINCNLQANVNKTCSPQLPNYEN